MASWSPDFALFTACAIAALPSCSSIDLCTRNPGADASRRPKLLLWVATADIELARARLSRRGTLAPLDVRRVLRLPRLYDHHRPDQAARIGTLGLEFHPSIPTLHRGP